MIISDPACFHVERQISDADLESLPNVPAVYVFWPSEGHPYLSRTAQLRRRLKRMLLPRTGVNSFHDLRNVLSRVEYWPYASRLEGSLVQYFLARQLFADDYQKRLRLRLSHFVHVTVNDPFPRLTITTKPQKGSSATFGPFRSRDSAEAFEQECLSLFQIRRCSETLHPHPEHLGCIYGEMNLCLRPCQVAVSENEYATEVKRLEEFLTNEGKTMLHGLSAARETASESLDFEQAARVHKQMEKVTGVLSLRDKLVTSVESLHGLAVTGSNRSEEMKLWPMIAGFWQRPIAMDLQLEAAASLPLDRRLRQLVSDSLTGSPTREGNRAEQIALLSRWYYSSWRDGEWLPFESPDKIEYRKVVRTLSKLRQQLQNGHAPPQ